jgi:hypothetical protein
MFWSWRPVLCCTLVACGRVNFGLISTDAPPADGSIDADLVAEIPDLLAVYPMDGMIMGGVVPASDAAYNGSCTAAECPTSVPGRIGGGYAFDAARVIQLPHAISTRIGADPFTIALWLSPVASVGDLAVFAKPYSATAGSDVVSLAVPAGQRYFTFETTPDGVMFDYLNTAPTTDVTDGWHHAALTWDGSSKRLYLDGAVVSTGATIAMSDQPLWIGVDFDNAVPVHHYMGALDDVRIYTRALRSSEIAMLAGR